jgi:hypothetical protein
VQKYTFININGLYSIYFLDIEFQLFIFLLNVDKKRYSYFLLVIRTGICAMFIEKLGGRRWLCKPIFPAGGGFMGWKNMPLSPIILIIALYVT